MRLDRLEIRDAENRLPRGFSLADSSHSGPCGRPLSRNAGDERPAGGREGVRAYFFAAGFLSSFLGVARAVTSASHLSSSAGMAASLALAAPASVASEAFAASNASPMLLPLDSQTAFSGRP